MSEQDALQLGRWLLNRRQQIAKRVSRPVPEGNSHSAVCDLTTKEDHVMVAFHEKAEFVRLEDFIHLAEQGKDVQLHLELRRQAIKQKVHQGEMEQGEGETNAYLLIGDYNFRMEGDRYRVSKIYVLGSAEEPADVAQLNSHIANERLKMDYQRLAGAGIILAAKYF
jgi:hypothetical protein